MTASIDDRSFRKALSCFASGVTVVTSLDEDDNPVGLTVSAFTSVSIDPPLILICLGKQGRNLKAFEKGHFAVNVLSEAQRELSIRFASGRGDQWDGLSFQDGVGGSPVFSGCLATIECALETVHDGGDHLVIVGRVKALESTSGGQPLLYFRGGYASIGPQL